jgi:hypothetical protein
MPLSRPCRRIAPIALAAALLSQPLATASAQEPIPSPTLNFGIGWSMLHINDIEFTAITDFFATEVLDHETDQDGELNGYKLTGELAGLMPHRRGDWLASLAVKGFYARYEDTEHSQCNSSPDTDCVFFPLTDPETDDIFPDVSGGTFADWLTDVDRTVVHWGAAIEINLDRYAAPVYSLKDGPAPVEASPFLWRAGLAVRRLDQELSLVSVDTGPFEDPVTLNEDLDATYYGGYVGFTAWKPLDDGVRIRLSGETGIYYADAEYEGAYTATDTLGGGGPNASSIALDDSAPAFIGLLNLALERDFGGVTLALFGEAEWISYVPKVLYNDTDVNDGVPFDIIGTQDGTELGNGSALIYTLGARLSLPLQ